MKACAFVLTIIYAAARAAPAGAVQLTAENWDDETDGVCNRVRALSSAKQRATPWDAVPLAHRTHHACDAGLRARRPSEALTLFGVSRQVRVH